MRRLASRLLLVAVAVLGIVAAIRLGDAGSHAAVWMDGLEPDRLRHHRFEVERPVGVAIAGAGSFEDVGDALATEAWITDADGEVVWRFAPRRGSGTFATATDTLDLATGNYDVYFASFGTGAAAAQGEGLGARIRHAMTRGQAWRGDAGRWRLSVEAASSENRDALRRLSGDDDQRAARGAAWSSGPLHDDDSATETFVVDDTTRVGIRAVLEATPRGVRDRAALVRLGSETADTLWAFSHAGSRAAGGAARNRRADAELTLTPGLYRIVAETDARHAFDDWRATPPDAPWMWGVTLTADGGGLGRLQPSDDFALPIIAAFSCVGPDETLEDTFTLSTATEVVVTSAGEVFEDGRYDYGWLDRVDGSHTDRLWELRRRSSVPAGGDDKNRMGIEVLSLRPGTYTLGYKTDGSHDCHNFNSDAPADPTFWGASLFALSPAFDAETVQRAAPAPEPTPPVRVPDPQPTADGEGSAQDDDDDGPSAPIAALERVALGADEATGFEGPTSGRVLISANGRTAPDGPQAYGWIEDADGETVWSSRSDEHVGKRYVMDFFELVPGASYTLRYHVDPEPSGSSFEMRSIRVVPLGG